MPHVINTYIQTCIQYRSKCAQVCTRIGRPVKRGTDKQTYFKGRHDVSFLRVRDLRLFSYKVKQKVNVSPKSREPRWIGKRNTHKYIYRQSISWPRGPPNRPLPLTWLSQRPWCIWATWCPSLHCCWTPLSPRTHLETVSKFYLEWIWPWREEI